MSEGGVASVHVSQKGMASAIFLHIMKSCIINAALNSENWLISNFIFACWLVRWWLVLSNSISDRSKGLFECAHFDALMFL